MGATCRISLISGRRRLHLPSLRKSVQHAELKHQAKAVGISCGRQAPHALIVHRNCSCPWLPLLPIAGDSQCRFALSDGDKEGPRGAMRWVGVAEDEKKKGTARFYPCSAFFVWLRARQFPRGLDILLWFKTSERCLSHCHHLKIMVGAAGFELATLCSQSRCATRLRYAPTKRILRGFAGRFFEFSKIFQKYCACHLLSGAKDLGHGLPDGGT